ncbi:MAG: hypothetical protein VR65_17845 [Desulfobulbaceae bacterium BRH_c16a]|nr:MAG: hypothetical protein VR65_17845 [Desulfobulbaceae bacterium BRH_c16a]
MRLIASLHLPGCRQPDENIKKCPVVGSPFQSGSCVLLREVEEYVLTVGDMQKIMLQEGIQ